MGAPIVVGILAAIRAGVPAAKLIIKYGKKAYDAAKKSTTKKLESTVKKLKGPKEPKSEIIGQTFKNIDSGKKTNVHTLGMGPGRFKKVHDITRKEALKKNKGGPVDARKIAKKYFKGTF